MKSFLWFLLVPASMALYIATVSKWGPYQFYPWPSYLLALAGVCGVFFQWRRQRRAGRLIWLAAAVVSAGLFVWWTLDYSTYKVPQKVVRESVGKPLLDAATDLKKADGVSFDLQREVAKHRLTALVFYRGYW
ncbi:MAG: hypothetical protein KDK99_16745 [Verrucomicrobiales bacterium]|nr:hypothetical protein [Verrucomicrobiales bacterium]